MWKKLACLCLGLLLLLAVSAALAEAPSAAQFEKFLAAEKEKAAEADHILGPSDVDNVQAHSMTIILPGETVAVVPDASYNPNGIQGGIAAFDFTIFQLNDPVVNTTT